MSDMNALTLDRKGRPHMQKHDITVTVLGDSMNPDQERLTTLLVLTPPDQQQDLTATRPGTFLTPHSKGLVITTTNPEEIETRNPENHLRDIISQIIVQHRPQQLNWGDWHLPNVAATTIQYVKQSISITHDTAPESVPVTHTGHTALAHPGYVPGTYETGWIQLKDLTGRLTTNTLQKYVILNPAWLVTKTGIENNQNLDFLYDTTTTGI